MAIFSNASDATKILNSPVLARRLGATLALAPFAIKRGKEQGTGTKPENSRFRRRFHSIFFAAGADLAWVSPLRLSPAVLPKRGDDHAVEILLKNIDDSCGPFRLGGVQCGVDGDGFVQLQGSY